MSFDVHDYPFYTLCTISSSGREKSFYFRMCLFEMLLLFFFFYEVRVPESRSLEFETLFSRWIAGATLPDEAVHQATFGAIVKL